MRNLVAAGLAAGIVALSGLHGASAEIRPRPKPDGGSASTSAAVPRPAPKGNVARSAPLTMANVANQPARDAFGAQDEPAPLAARAIGSYARGCLAGAKPLAVDGTTWQVMRLSRNRNWGHPALVKYLEDLAKEAPKIGWRGLLVGDLAQPRGGPMLTGHNSHQIGLDADIWLTPMPDRKLSTNEREKMSATSMLGPKMGKAEIPEGGRVDKAIWTEAHARLLKTAASDPRVARIFVHPAIKKTLCDWATGDRSWLRRVRPWYGHHYHFHIRLSCPSGGSGCKNQDPPPAGDGCDQSLSWWLSDAPYAKRRARRAAAEKAKGTWRPMTVQQLPAACTQVLVAR